MYIVLPPPRFVCCVPIHMLPAANRAFSMPWRQGGVSGVGWRLPVPLLRVERSPHHLLLCLQM